MIFNGLSAHEIEEAIDFAMAVRRYVRTKNVSQYWGRTDRRKSHCWDTIYSKVGECGVAKLLRIPWPNRSVEDEFKGGGDVGGIVEVRARAIPGSGYDLGIRPIDLKKSANKPFVLVHWHWASHAMDIVGFAYPEEAPERGQWNESSGCWYLPPPYGSIDDLVAIYGNHQQDVA